MKMSDFLSSSLLQSASLLHLKHQLPPSSLIRIVKSSHYLILAFEYLILNWLHLFREQELLLYVCLELLDLFFTCFYLVLCLADWFVLFVLYLTPELLVLTQEPLTVRKALSHSLVLSLKITVFLCAPFTLGLLFYLYRRGNWLLLGFRLPPLGGHIFCRNHHALRWDLHLFPYLRWSIILNIDIGFPIDQGFDIDSPLRTLTKSLQNYLIASAEILSSTVADNLITNFA